MSAYAFGVMAQVSGDGVRLVGCRVAGAAELAGVRAFEVRGNWLSFPVQELGRRFGVEGVGWRSALRTVTVRGRPAFGVTLIDTASPARDRVEPVSLGSVVRRGPWPRRRAAVELLDNEALVEASGRPSPHALTAARGARISQALSSRRKPPRSCSTASIWASSPAAGASLAEQGQ